MIKSLGTTKIYSFTRGGSPCEAFLETIRLDGVLVQTGKRIGDKGIRRIAKLNGILYLLDVGSKTTSFSSAFAGIFASD